MFFLFVVCFIFGFVVQVNADDIEIGDKVTLFADTYLWASSDIDAEKVVVLLEPTEVEILGECEQDRYPVQVGLLNVYVDKFVLEQAVNGKTFYSEEEQTQLREDVVNYALQFLRNPYVWGGTSLTEGADCSGFVQRVFADHGVYLPRTSQEQGVFGKRLSVYDAQKGDLILYSDSDRDAYHVALYMGDGMTVQAANSREGIIMRDANGSSWAVDVIGD